MKLSYAFLLGIGTLLSSTLITRADIKVTVDHNTGDKATPEFKFKNVPAPAKNDAGAKAKFTVVDGRNDPNSGEVAVLNDGKLPAQEDEPASNFFFDAGTDGGRVQADLGSVIAIKQVNTYSWHPSTRAPQVYTLYASDGTAAGFKASPITGTDPTNCGWKLIAKVDTRPKEGEIGGQYGVSIADSGGNLGKYRYLLFDCSQTETDDGYGNTFYSEIDIVSDGETKEGPGAAPAGKPAENAGSTSANSTAKRVGD